MLQPFRLESFFLGKCKNSVPLLLYNFLSYISSQSFNIFSIASHADSDGFSL